jgi:hypothetical protein
MRHAVLLIFTISKHPYQNLEIRLTGNTSLSGEKSVKRRREEASRNLEFLLKETNMKALLVVERHRLDSRRVQGLGREDTTVWNMYGESAVSRLLHISRSKWQNS